MYIGALFEERGREPGVLPDEGPVIGAMARCLSLSDKGVQGRGVLPAEGALSPGVLIGEWASGLGFLSGSVPKSSLWWQGPFSMRPCWWKGSAPITSFWWRGPTSRCPLWWMGLRSRWPPLCMFRCLTSLSSIWWIVCILPGPAIGSKSDATKHVMIKQSNEKPLSYLGFFDSKLQVLCQKINYPTSDLSIL
jgi:hypothetical protein